MAKQTMDFQSAYNKHFENIRETEFPNLKGNNLQMEIICNLFMHADVICLHLLRPIILSTTPGRLSLGRCHPAIYL